MTQTSIRSLTRGLTFSLVIAALCTTAATEQRGAAPAKNLTSVASMSLADAYAAARYAARPSGTDAWHASNPGQAFAAHFTPERVTLTPTAPSADSPRWRFALALESIGYGSDRIAPAPGIVTAVNDRVEIRHAAADDRVAVTEWYINRRSGLEQGFTLPNRPARFDGRPLRVRLATDGSLQPRVSPSQDAIAFTSADGRAVLNYDHLIVTDRDGRTIPSHFESSGTDIAIVVDDAQAMYPLTIDPTVTQEAYLKSANAGAGDLFGASVAISGDTAVIGAQSEASSSTGVNSTPNELAATAGAAYVFVRSNLGAWTQQAYLKASNTGAGDQFGLSVSISGDTIVVGAQSEASNATGVNGNQADNSAAAAGAAYVFVRSGTTWTQQAYLKASNTGAGDLFGRSVSISGELIVIGATGEDDTFHKVRLVRKD